MSLGSRRVRIDLAYDGTEFHGWQLQPRDRTVQGELERALSRLSGGARVPVRGAGRTDAGVHARGQVADALLPERLGDGEVLRALSRILPPDVRVRGVRTVRRTFHAWHDARTKTYAYRLDRSDHGDPFLARFTLHRPGEIDRAAIEEGLRKLPGRKDWSGFTDSRCDKEDRVRTLFEARYREGGAVAVFEFRADGFLTRMVRNLVGTLLDVGEGRIPPGRIDEILESRNRGLAGATAAARGLSLERVEYDPADAAGPAARVGRSEEGPWLGSW